MLQAKKEKEKEKMRVEKRKHLQRTMVKEERQILWKAMQRQRVQAVGD